MCAAAPAMAPRFAENTEGKRYSLTPPIHQARLSHSLRKRVKSFLPKGLWNLMVRYVKLS